MHNEQKKPFDRQAYMKEYYRKNREKIRERSKEHYYNNKEHYKKIKSERYYEKKEKGGNKNVQ